jgi:hypothetical protein
LYNDETSLTREIQGGKGTTNQHSLVQHFGLGNYEAPLMLEITFPTGEKRLQNIIEVNQLVLIVE